MLPAPRLSSAGCGCPVRLATASRISAAWPCFASLAPCCWPTRRTTLAPASLPPPTPPPPPNRPPHPSASPSRVFTRTHKPAIIHWMLGSAANVVSLRKDQTIKLKETYHNFRTRCGGCWLGLLAGAAAEHRNEGEEGGVGGAIPGGSGSVCVCVGGGIAAVRPGGRRQWGAGGVRQGRGVGQPADE